MANTNLMGTPSEPNPGPSGNDFWGWDDMCIYCQRRFASAANLRRHVKKLHRDTYAYWSLLDWEQSRKQKDSK